MPISTEKEERTETLSNIAPSSQTSTSKRYPKSIHFSPFPLSVSLAHPSSLAWIAPTIPSGPLLPPSPCYRETSDCFNVPITSCTLASGPPKAPGLNPSVTLSLKAGHSLAAAALSSLTCYRYGSPCPSRPCCLLLLQHSSLDPASGPLPLTAVCLLTQVSSHISSERFSLTSCRVFLSHRPVVPYTLLYFTALLTTKTPLVVYLSSIGLSSKYRNFMGGRTTAFLHPVVFPEPRTFSGT